MFRICCEPDERYPRAVGRLVFGACMLVGVVVIVHRLFAGEPGVGPEIVMTWVSSAIAGWVAHQLAHGLPSGKRPDRIFVLSFALQALGIACLLPLSIHLAGAHALGLASDFDTWVKMSCFWAGPAHVAFAYLATKRAVQLARGEDAITTRSVYTRTLLISSIPGGLVVLPPLIVGFTGLFIMPLLERMQPYIRRERDPLVLPMAIVV